VSIEGLLGWLWALPLFMLWFVPAQWFKTKERQYAIAVERAGPGADAALVNVYLDYNRMGQGFWLFVIVTWAIVGGTVTWLAAYGVLNGPLILAIPLGLFLLGTAFNTGVRNIGAVAWFVRQRKAASIKAA
jgi:hypothetical protein